MIPRKKSGTNKCLILHFIYILNITNYRRLGDLLFAGSTCEETCSWHEVTSGYGDWLGTTGLWSIHGWLSG